MKKIIFTILGISVLFLGCQSEPIDVNGDSLLSLSGKSSLISGDCEPDIEALVASLPDVVSAKTTAKPGNNAYFSLDILDSNLAGVGIPAWCVDQDLNLDVEGPFNFAVYSSYETLPAGEFEKPENFDLVNWLLNQSYVGQNSPLGGQYTFGHIQYAIWILLDDSLCVDCTYLTDPTGTWGSDPGNIHKAIELANAAEANGQGYIPGCGEQFGIVLIPEGKQAIIITKEVPAKEVEVECFECEGKVTELELQYNGASAAKVTVETKKDGENDEKIVFDGTLMPGQNFSFTGNDKKGTLGSEITIYINGKKHTEIHTSCSDPIGPGLISGDFEVIRGASKDGGELCPIETTPGEDCSECEGKITELELQYNGASAAKVTVETKKDGENDEKIVFDGTLMPGQNFSFTGNDKKGTLGSEITIYINGKKHTEIHTSCSNPIGPGLISGDFEVIRGASREGGELCPINSTPPNGDDCNECEGKVTRLDLQFNSNTAANIKVVQKKDNIVAFEGYVQGGAIFSFSGKDDKGTLGTEITIYVNGQESQKIHTSCSVEIGAGAIFGNYTVIGGASREGGELCPVETTTPPNGDDCSECEGKVTRLDLQFNGNSSADIKVVQKKDNIVAFSGNVGAGQTFTFSGKDDKGTLGTEIIIYVNGVESQRIHTSCSVPIGAGAIFGNFKVIGGASREGGELCPVETSPPKGDTCDCDGKIVKMTVTYNGPSGATIVVTGDKGGSQTFSNVQPGDKLTPTLGSVGNWWYYSVNGSPQAQIHTSCSDDILGNKNAHKSTFGDLGSYPDPVDGDNNGTFLVTSHTDEKGNTCSI
ncbi:hypothetical protein [Mariniflexile sp. AS56]|uniref:DUF7467 domain-containing protein n=1 Tax=Mariniflexile sp. AS56 TaxID=3063957 RepID=UPI0026EFAFF5|nr:hypothetical protein [Mariniflexile sp. AS56]MDO7171318.1 hypothetical protein [Mariniflexile sp. AS56]